MVKYLTTFALLGSCAIFAMHHMLAQRANNVLSTHDDPSRRNLKSTTGLDFLVAGFPKCGTTSIRNLLVTHEGTNIMHKYKENKFGVVQEVEYFLQSGLKIFVDELFEDIETNAIEGMKNGIKWPDAVIERNVMSLSALRDFNPEGHMTNIVVGLRHPLKWFESFYNYRVMGETLVARRGGTEDELKFPDPYSLIGGKKNSWRLVYTELARWELSLMQLGKWSLSPEELMTLSIHDKMWISTPYKFFFYEVGQLSDPDEERNALFRKDLSDFLELDTIIEPIPHANNQHKHERMDGQIDICESHYDDLRIHILNHAKDTVEFMKNRLPKGRDVVIGGEDHFMELVEEWDQDPCDAQAE